MVFTPSSIGYYLHYSVIVHFIERKSIIHCINIDGCFQASMKWGGQGKRGGGGGSEQLYKFQWMPHYQALGSKEKKSLKHTHALRLHIDCIVSCMYEPCHTELTSRFKQTPKIRELIFTFS